MPLEAETPVTVPATQEVVYDTWRQVLLHSPSGERESPQATLRWMFGRVDSSGMFIAFRYASGQPIIRELQFPDLFGFAASEAQSSCLNEDGSPDTRLAQALQLVEQLGFAYGKKYGLFDPAGQSKTISLPYSPPSPSPAEEPE